MINQHTNYQASFSVKDPDKEIIHRFRSTAFDWLKKKESDGGLRERIFLSRDCHYAST
ncbi:hypothetical protein N9B14_04375 [Akkermansiaceae bacterium]|nr:hypothetical protein [Akkermansiaceae bacterium]